MEYQNENFSGEYDFRSRFHKGWYMQANLHEYSELIYCQKGSGYVTVNGNAIFLRENEMIWIISFKVCLLTYSSWFSVGKPALFRFSSPADQSLPVARFKSRIIQTAPLIGTSQKIPDEDQRCS